MKLRAATVTDGYKVSHGMMYADGTSKVYSNLTPRSDKIYLRNCTRFYGGKLVFVGAQGAVQEIMEMWEDSFFSKPSVEVIGRFATRMQGYLGGDVAATAQLRELHKLGYLPLEIKALPEGRHVAMGIPVLTVTNTVAAMFWLVNYLETVLSDLIWKSSTNATIAMEYKAICQYYAEQTGTDDFSVSIQCHDFSMRGMSGPEDAARSGFAHLTSFIGTDVLPALDYAEDYYGVPEGAMIAISVPATEHAVATNNILSIEQRLLTMRIQRADPRLLAEKMFMQDLITRKFPNGIISYVADSFSFWSVLEDILPELKETIMAREASDVAPGKLVIRPDSGDPVDVVCGTISSHYDTLEAALDTENNNHYEEAVEACDGGHGQGCASYASVVFVRENSTYYEITSKFGYYVDEQTTTSVEVVATPEMKGAVQCLWETFGGTVTDKGYKLLDSHIGLIYGDSITTNRAVQILSRLMAAGFASGNIVFGVGSYTYQCNTRDTFGFAVKATYSVVNGCPVNIFKDPKTDSKKKSAKGLLRVNETEGGVYSLEDQVTEERSGGALQLIFLDGEFVARTTLDEIRANVSKG